MNKKILITIIALISIILLVVVGIYIFKVRDTSTNKNNEVKETLKEKNQNNSEIDVDKNDEQNDEEIEESNDKENENVESNSNDVDNSIKENDSNNENSTPNKDNSNNNTNQSQNNNQSNSTSDDSPKEQTPWEKLGITEYEYYNTPVWSWQNVDFGVDLEGDKYCANETDCLSKCQKYGDEYLSQNNNGGYNCDDVLSYSGRYLGVDFEFFELQP